MEVNEPIPAISILATPSGRASCSATADAISRGAFFNFLGQCHGGITLVIAKTGILGGNYGNPRCIDRFIRVKSTYNVPGPGSQTLIDRFYCTHICPKFYGAEHTAFERQYQSKGKLN